LSPLNIDRKIKPVQYYLLEYKTIVIEYLLSIIHMHSMSRLLFKLLTIFLFCINQIAVIVDGLLSSSWRSPIAHLLEHLVSPPLQITPLEDLTNTRIPGPIGSNIDIFAYVATPSSSKTDIDENNDNKSHVLILIHEFFGLNQQIVEKAKGLAEDLGCVVIAPDTFRGIVTDFIPQAIWLALTTPQDRVNNDLDAICSYINSGEIASCCGGIGKLAIMGFCYGGGKAIRYSTQRQTNAATVVFYGSPITDVSELQRLQAPVCGIYARNDAQFSMRLVDTFREALTMAKVENNIRVYDNVGHAFWANMEQIRKGDEPQTIAYRQCTNFLKDFFSN